uniref:Protein CIP2A n=1 Tax=Steinernema glaseri TaxID=37863 RepID=A0A1I8ALY5_9BILA
MGTRSKGELSRILQDVLLISKQYCHENDLRAANLLEDALSNAVSATKNVDWTSRLSLDDLYVPELLKLIDMILSSSDNSALLRSKLNLLLFNIAFYNLELRQLMAVDLSMCASAFICLKQSIRDELGPQNLIDILRLIQVLTYEKKLPLGTWTNECIAFLLTEICKPNEPEWLSNCCAILCNLVSRSKTVCTRIKKAESYKLLQKRMIDLLAHDSRTVVVSVLVVIGYLDEKLRDTVFCSSNIPQTFQCLFNVLDQSDGLMTRHIGSDLLKRLVVAENPTGLGGSVLTTTVANLFLHLDPRTEESLKMYELLLAFCSVPSLRTPICSAILSAPISAARAASPLWAITKTAKMSLSEAVKLYVPTKACHLLRYLLKEVFDSGQKVSDFVQLSVISEIVANSMEVLQKLDGSMLAERCQLLTEGLRIAEVAAVDDELRAELLNVVSSGMCAKILDDQFAANPVVNQLSSPHAMDEAPEWSVYGTEIVLELTKLLATLKDFSKLHKDLYWRTLKDERLIPFIAFAIVSGSGEMVSAALLLYSHCKQVAEFQTSWLGGLIAFSRRSSRDSHTEHRGLNGSCSSNLNESFGSRVHMGGDELSASQVDDLLAKAKQGNEKDSRLQQIVSAFEQKMSMMETRKKDLERQLAARDRLLEQSEQQAHSRLRSTAESADLRQLSSLRTELTTALQQNEVLQKENHNLAELLETQQVENLEERKMHGVLREKFDDMTTKFTLTSRTLFEAEGQVKKLTEQLAQLADVVKGEHELSKKLREEVAAKERNIASLDVELQKETKERSRLENALKDEKRKSSELEFHLATKDAHIRKLEEEIRMLNAELEKLREEQKKSVALKQQMMAMMNNM